MRKVADPATVKEIEESAEQIYKRYSSDRESMYLLEVADPRWRQLFDQALDELHYAGSCQRVGRCMRLAVMENRQWIGGIVLGSTFPNILVRDEALGLRSYVEGYKQRGLTSPWSRENAPYWGALQKIVNHARTFIFPRFQNDGRGIRAHALLLTEGVALWKDKYQDDVAGFDTLCTHEDSRLFKDNGWRLVGRTKGYSSDPSEVFSKRAFAEDWKAIKNNVALGKIEGSPRWFVWVKPLTE